MNVTQTSPAAAPRFALANVLWFDAATCALMGIFLVALAEPLAGLLGLPLALLQWAGVLLLPCALLMAVAARRPQPALVMLIVAGNLLWVAASVVVLLTSPAITTLGQAFVIAQAAVVLLLAWLEWRG
jgi:hypothetical protein